MPHTLHIPLTPEGSYVYVWFGRGLSFPIHIRYGHILCLSGGVMHCGGLPTLPNGLSHTHMLASLALKRLHDVVVIQKDNSLEWGSLVKGDLHMFPSWCIFYNYCL
jgi:hypothetical protein